MSYDTLRPTDREDPAVMEAVRAHQTCVEADRKWVLVTGKKVTTHPLLIGNPLYRTAR